MVGFKDATNFNTMSTMSITEQMQWRLIVFGFTPTLSKRSQTLLLKWAESKGLKAEGFESHGRYYAQLIEEEEHD